VQVEVSLNVWLKAPSVPQENVVGVQLSLVAGSVVQLHKELATVVPSLRVQETV
jgi:hypothetical protein